MYGVLTLPGKAGQWDEQEFYEHGRLEVGAVFGQLGLAGVEPPTDSVLDFGSGAGRLCMALAERFEQVDGVDISTSMVDFANQHNTVGSRVRFHHYDGVDLSMFADNTFGMVLSLITLQHVPPQSAERYLAEFVRVVRPGGVVAFQTLGTRDTPRLRSRVRVAAHMFWRHQIRRQLRFDVHTRPIEEITAIVEGAGATVASVIPDMRGGTWGPSFLTVAVKRQ
jgi:cyclopropane fatty-acyl-phospholipid synthase-like methyltransferase